MRLSFILTLIAASGMAPEPGDSTTPRLEFTVKPAASGRQLVRVSLPFPPGVLPEGQNLAVSTGGRPEITAGVRVLTWHPAPDAKLRSARRAVVTFPWTFASREPVTFLVEPTTSAIEPKSGVEPTPAAMARVERLPVEVKWNGSAVTIVYRDGPTLAARLLAPARISQAAPTIETVESNVFFLWQHVRFPDERWPRVIEIRADATGGVVLVAHLKRDLPGDAYAPDLGWQIETDASASPGPRRPGDRESSSASLPFRHDFTKGTDCEFLFDQGGYRLYHPAAPFQERGHVEVRRSNSRGFVYRYLRCTAGEQVPMQQAAWRRAEVVVARATLAPLSATLESPHEEHVNWRLWNLLYETGPPLDLANQPGLAALLRFHHDAIVRSAARGDDWGNVTYYSDSRNSGGPFGMNRLNHCPAIFEEAWRSGDRRLRDVAVNWCDNFHDLSIWWGPDRTGGTRYNNILAQNRAPLDNDRHFMWRSNDSVDFCTKGYRAFLLAYEQTGDPLHREALEAQVKYASQYVHTDRGEARNIGDADDFVRLYHDTGEVRYRDEALRLFRELRTKLSAGNLFSQSGHPIEPHPPFINDDDTGYRHPFAKPYIIGYALLGLPRLAQHAQAEPKLREVVKAVADFMAASQDPAGGWRYPHPRSSYLILDQAMEHAWQIVVADGLLGPQPEHLDAIERVLRQRYHGWQAKGSILCGVAAWELVTGRVKKPAELTRLYRHPEDRDFARDYTEGRLAFGSSQPEGLVYFPGVLAFYLKHRPASRLLTPPSNDDPLGKLLAGVNAGKTASGAPRRGSR
jgi:hypothetical protein